MNPAEPWMVRMIPAVIGSMSRPELAAESPELICRNVGMNAIAENIPSPTARPIAVATTKVRLPNSVSGMIGSVARRSTNTKTTAAMTNAASSARVPGAPQPSLPPKSVNSTSDVVVAESATMPAWSSGVVLRLRGRVRANQPIVNAARPTGTLIQKHHCQPNSAESVKKPPTRGPATAERPNSAPIGPMYFARSRAGTTSAMIACDRIISPPPPRPWTPRQMTSQVKSGERAAPRLATVKSPIAVRSRVRRPKEERPQPTYVHRSHEKERRRGSRRGSKRAGGRRRLEEPGGQDGEAFAAAQRPAAWASRANRGEESAMAHAERDASKSNGEP